jgi:hypothetical protein
MWNRERILNLVAAGALLTIAAAPAWAERRPRTELEPRLVPVPVERCDALWIDVWTDAGEGAVLRRGDEVDVRFRTSDDAFVVVYNVDTRGRVRLLFPETPWDDGFVAAGRIVRVPSARAGYRLMVTGPAGVERVVALASHRPLASRWRELAEADLAAGRGDRAEDWDLRGYAVEPGSVTIEGRVRLETPHAGLDLQVAKAPVEPRLVPVPVTPRLQPVPIGRRGIARDATWFRVAGPHGWR